MPPTKLVIPQSTTALPSCTPNLMPFHINYTGPAAVSAFMRVKKLVVEEIEKEGDETEANNDAPASMTKKESQDTTEDVEMTSDAQAGSSTTRLSAAVDPEATPAPSTSSESQTTIVASESQTPSLLSASSSLATLAPPQTSPSVPPIEDADKRFVSTFRGRTIHGLTIDLPAGFSGLVLQTESRDQGPSKGSGAVVDSKAKATGKTDKSSARGKGKKEEEKEAPSTRRRGRLTRSTLPTSNPTKPIEIPDDQDEVMADATGKGMTLNDNAVVPDVAGEDDAAAIRHLVPTAQFSTFTLWQADRVVDKGRDEYFRSLTEWVAIANEIHRVD